jgi:glutaredoxin
VSAHPAGAALTARTALGAVLTVAALLPLRITAQQADSLDIEVFVREGCPHCAAAERWLEELHHVRPGLRVVFHDVAADARARARLLAVAREHGIGQPGVPTFLVRGHALVGFEDGATTGGAIIALLDATPPLETGAARDAVATPLGSLSASELGLPLFTVAIGLLDGFNPCAMWALLFILSLLANFRSRRRMLLVGGAFVLTAGAVYYLFLAAWLEVFLFVGWSRRLELVLGGVALAVGVVNVKDFAAFGRGISLSIPEAAKPRLYAAARRVLTAESLGAALVAVIALSALVNLVELACTAGLPAAYTEILTAQGVGRGAYYGYLGLYILAYVLDDSVMLAIAVATLGLPKLQERGGRWLKLLSGVVMVGLGLTLWLVPEWLR